MLFKVLRVVGLSGVEKSDFGGAYSAYLEAKFGSEGCGFVRLTRLRVPRVL